MELPDLLNCTPEAALSIGMSEAQRLQKTHSRPRASYMLHLVQERFALEGKEVPQELKDLRQRIHDECKDIWSPKIYDALEQNDDELAARYFGLAIMGFKDHPKLPFQFYVLREAINRKARSSLAAELVNTYRSDRFEQA